MSPPAALFTRAAVAILSVLLFTITLNTPSASAQDDGNCSEGKACADDNWTCYFEDDSGCYTGGFCIAVLPPGRIPCCDVDECEPN